MLEKFCEHDIDIHMLFIDFKEACESIRRDELYEVMLRMGIPVKITNLVRMFMDNTSAKAKVGNKLSEPFQFNTGVEQRDGLSTALFNIPLHNDINKIDQK
jgi:hypothetical protein